MEQIAIYLRLSKEDEFVKDESNSITNQRDFIRGFINKNKYAGTGEKKADFMRHCKGFFQIFQRSYRAGKIY